MGAIRHWLGLLLCCYLGLCFSETELKYYRPFDPLADQAKTVVGSEKRGMCVGQSHLIKRADAWVCVSEGRRYDPCFTRQKGGDKSTLCPKSPWDGQATLIQVNQPLDTRLNIPLDMSSAFPWVIELKGGTRCHAIEKGGVYDNQPVRYVCDDDSLLFGKIQRCDPTWTVLRKNKSSVNTATLSKVWF